MDRIANIDERLKSAAQEGDIDLLYTLIQENPDILKNIDSTPFVETPLHVAASFGHLQFATEVVRLKPSFAWKLNQQGFCPIHLAMQQDQWRMVLRLADINSDLVRVKGRGGLTPLHLASQIGDVDLLARFLFACPNSIEDVTVRSETALHIAVKSKQYEALQVLVGWLKITNQEDAHYLQRIILNWKDEAGNTILHVSALNNFSQALRLLVKTSGMALNAKNLENSTALDIATSEEIKGILCASKRAKHGSSVTNAPSLADMLLRSKILDVGQITIVPLFRLRSEISDKQRSAFLVVMALVATASFQTALNPPGGVYRANTGDAIVNCTATAAQGNVGKVVMSNVDFSFFSILSGLSFLFSTLAIYILTPGAEAGIMFLSLFMFICCYLYSLKVITPKGGSAASFHIALATLFFLLVGVYFMNAILLLYGLPYFTMRLEAKRRNRKRGNRW